MPTRNGDRSGMTFADVLAQCKGLEETYGVRIRLATVPLSKVSGKSTHALEARAYTLQGKPLQDVEREQCLWPGGTSKTREGAEIYLLVRLEAALDEWYARKRREEEQRDSGALTLLEEYIARSFSS